MGCCCKKRPVPINIVVSPEHFIDKKDIEKGKKLISLNDFEILKLIGKGTFAKVFLVRNKANQKIYSMKKLNKPFIKQYKQEQHTINERILLSKMDYPFLIKLYCCFQDQEHLYFIMEFAQGGELFFHLHKEKRFKDEKAKFYIIEIILAIEYLHKNKMLYRDLKPENVLIDTNGHIKLTDFGLSKIIQKPKEKAYTICGTPQYLAPEVLSDKGYDCTVDWWSLGCVLYELLVGRSPFRILLGDSLNEDFYKKKILIPDYVSDEAQDLITKLLIINPLKRSGYGEDGANKIKQHPYFKGINWDDAWNLKLKPPFIPNLSNETDLKYFDNMITDEKLNSDSDLSGISTLNSNSHKDFKGFTYVADSMGNELMIMDNSNDDSTNKV